MRRLSHGKLLFRNAFRLVTASCIASSAALMAPLAFTSDAFAQEQNEDTRVMWQIRYDDNLSAAQRDEIQNTLLSTLSRVKERHFATPSIISPS